MTEAQLLRLAAQTTVPRMPSVESALAWAAQQTYTGAQRAADEYGLFTGRVMFCDQPYYNAFTWRDETDDEHENRLAAIAEAHADATSC